MKLKSEIIDIGCVFWFVIIITIIALLSSCRTVRYVDRVQIQTDSTAIHQRDSIAQVKSLDSAAYVNMIEMLSHNEVIFQDTGSTRVEYYPDGSVKVIEGKLKALNISLSRSQKEAGYWKRAYDSLTEVHNNSNVAVKTEIRTVTVEKKTIIFPWYFWLITGFFLLIAICQRVIMAKMAKLNE